ncbi:MAG: type II secretion system protein [Puniceicoccales bacterium]
MNRIRSKQGMTLVELLVTISVVGILGAITVTAVGSVRDSANRVADSSSARQLATAYMMYPVENKGQLMPAKPERKELPFMGIKNLDGNPLLSGPAAERITFRLLPYVGGIDAFYPGESQDHLQSILTSGSRVDYDLSLFPSIGFNSIYIGGDYQSIRYEPHEIAVTHQAQVRNPSGLIVFATSFQGAGDFADTSSSYKGVVNVSAPKSGAATADWSSTLNDAIPATSGNVHFRHGGKALVANMDGSVEALTFEELKDMRRWSNHAYIANDPDYTP